MKKRLLLLAFTFSSILHAHETWTDPETGIAWKYELEGTTGVKLYGSAVNGIFTTCAKPCAGDIIIPSTINNLPVVGIMRYAFYKKTAMTSVVIPNTVESIGESAFYECSALGTITFPSQLRYIDGQAFTNCSALQDVILPNTLEAIGFAAFYRCNGLTTITIPDSVTTVGSSAFEGCLNLTSAVIGSGLGTCNGTIFRDCDNLKTLTFRGGCSFALGGDAIETVYAYGDTIDLALFASPLKCLYYTPAYKAQWESYLAHLTENLPEKWVCMGSKLLVVPPLFQGGEISKISEDIIWKEEISVTAETKAGYVFLGWSSDVEGVSGTEETITFTMPERDVTLVPNFFPKALIQSWINEGIAAQLEAGALVKPEDVESMIDAKIDGENLLTKAQSEAKTTAAIEQKVADKELVTVESIHVMAVDNPTIEVNADKTVEVGIQLLKATSLDGSFEPLAPEAGDEPEMDTSDAENPKIKVKVKADESAAFYKFVPVSDLTPLLKE